MVTERIGTSVLAGAALLVLGGCGGGGDGDAGPECGDGLCERAERDSCLEDCAGDVDGGGVTCTVDGVEYEPGVSFPAGDGCNTCACDTDGNVACTEIACPPESGCRTYEDCTDVGGHCAAPGSSGGTGCGVPCGLEACSSHDECTGGPGDGEVCHRARFEPYDSCCAPPTPTSGRCGRRCDGESGVGCEDGNRCADDGACEPIPCTDDAYDCREAARCAPDAAASDPHGCEPIPCDEGYECPAHTTCDPSAAGHGCQRDSCESDGDCDGGGYCVVGSCYESLGSCEQPAP